VDAAGQQALQKAVTATELRGKRKIHLVIVMSRSETAPDRFRVDAYRVLARPGQTSWSDGDVERLSCDGERLYALNEIPEPLNDLVLELDGDLSQSRNPLTIELFLPLDLLCCDADRWKLTDDSIPLGVDHEVVVRSWERAYGVLKGHRAPWQAKWQKICGAAAGHVWVCEHQDVATGLTPKLGPHGPACVAMRFTPAQDASDSAPAVLRKLIQAGIPIAVWPRETPNGAWLKEWFKWIEDLVENSPFLWHEAVRQYRSNAHEAGEQAAHPGHHLTVLRDDPNKLLPDARRDARLASPVKTRIPST
jgi:hypothetical protein